MQLEMTRRVALFVSAELRRQQQLAQNPAAGGGDITGARATLTTAGGQTALAIPGSYAQTWRILGIGLDKASFALEKQDYASGTYQVQYQPQSAEKQDKQGFWSRLWGGKKKADKTNAPRYRIRLADQGSQSVAVVQTLDGQPAPENEAKALLETVQSAL